MTLDEGRANAQLLHTIAVAVEARTVEVALRDLLSPLHQQRM